MIKGVDHVWTNFSRFSLFDAPNGWLLSQKSNLLIFFESCKSPEINNIKVYTHLFSSNEIGELGSFKNTRLHSLEAAFETWNELIGSGWIEVSRKIQ